VDILDSKILAIENNINQGLCSTTYASTDKEGRITRNNLSKDN